MAKKPATKKEPVKKATAKKAATKKEPVKKATAKKAATKKEPVKKATANKTTVSTLGVGTKILNPFSGRHIEVPHPFTGKNNNK